MVLALVAVSLAVVYELVSHDTLLLQSRLAEWKRSSGMYLDCRFYKTPEERLFNETLPRADYSRGGVYLLGASNTLTAVKAWELPPAQKQLFHNYCISAATSTQQFQFVRNLVEREGFLRAGGSKNAVIIGLFFGDGEHRASIDPSSMFSGFFSPDVLYSYTPQGGIRPRPLSDQARAFRLEQNRNHAFWTWAANLTFHEPLDYLRPVHRRPSEENRSYWLNRLGPGWETGMDLEVVQLGQLVDYLQTRGVKVQAFFVPTASWTTGFPPAERYRQRVLPLLSSRAVELTDLSHLAADTDFMDSVHLGYSGVQKTDPIIKRIARDDLIRAGLLP